MSRCVLTAAVLSALSVSACAQDAKPADAAPRALTTEQDHRLMMKALNIKSLRRGADGMNRNAPNAANYDESKANPFPDLPDPLTLKNGEKVTTPDQWWNKRRPEIVEDFDREVYGRVPTDVPPVKWEVTGTTEEKVGETAAVTKKLVGHVDNAKCPQIKVDIQLTLTTPVDAKMPVPVMMEFGFGGFGPRPGGPPGKGTTLKGDTAKKKAGPPGGFGGGGPSWQQQVLAKGWGYAIIVPNSIQADNGAGLTKGIIGLCNKGQARNPDDWGALRAWAWGASRAVDYFETDKAVDATQVGIEGLSRYGKAALVAMAYDQRFAIGFIGSSGEGGAKLHRRNFGELVENLTGSGEYHWMAGNFLKYGGPLTPGDLPVDAHELIALCAPRPTFISYGASTGPGAEGQWVDQRGSFMSAVAAGPVFRLLGKKDLGTSEFPEVETGITDGDLAFRQHKGGHTTGPNWPTFLAFADRYINVKNAPATSGHKSWNRQMTSRISRPRMAGLLAVVFVTMTGAGARGDDGRWVGTWAAAPQLTEPANMPPEPGLADSTLRQVVHVSLGGKRLRVRFSNAFGTKSLTIVSAHVAASAGGGAIKPGSGKPLTFGGRTSATIPTGSPMVSDPIDFDLAPLSDLAVTIRIKDPTRAITGHPGARCTSYLQGGDKVTEPDLPQAARTPHWYYLCGVDVEAADAAVVAVLGDSITDGRGSPTDGNGRWTDHLARRLQEGELAARVGVLNQGLGGNRMLNDGLGPNALARLDRDVLSQPGVRWLIVLEGINDLGTRSATARDLISAYDQIILRTHARGIRVYAATLMPCEGSSYFNPRLEAARQEVNAWIRESGRFDAVIDFDAATRDPRTPTRLSVEVDGGDHLHPGPEGYKIMAASVDLRRFTS